MPGEFEPLSLIELLRERAAQFPEKQCYTFLPDGEQPIETATYSQLDAQARSVAAWLQCHGAGDRRVLLLIPQGIKYLVAFFGCVYARAVAVPAYPPKANRGRARIEAIVKNVDPAFILTTRSFLQQIRRLVEEWTGCDATVCAVEDLDENVAELWREPEISGETLAFIQYTSGSTASPKGVMITHRNVLDNE